VPLVFSLFFHKMSLIDENPLTPRSIFIHTVRKSLKLSQKLSNSVKFTDSLLRLEGQPAFRPDSGGQLMAVDMLLIDAKDSGEDIDIVVSSSQTNEEWELQSGDDMSGAGAVRRSHITRNNHITLLYKLSIT
ncbi:unnamed protein product, partial [Brassica oleracea var. botrytis]